jgi:hypothetical protein
LGEELFVPIFCLFLGDMMELLMAGRNLSANFSKLKMPCYVCKIPGSSLSAHRHESELRTLEENDKVISAALQFLREGHTSKADSLLTKFSLHPVEVIFSYGNLNLTSV